MSTLWEKRLKDYTVGEGCHTASELYADIDLHIQDWTDVSHGPNDRIIDIAFKSRKKLTSLQFILPVAQRKKKTGSESFCSKC